VGTPSTPTERRTDVEYVCELKLDGMSRAVLYETVSLHAASPAGTVNR